MMAFEKLRVVVADDDKHMRTLLTTMLRTMGIVRVSAADNAARRSNWYAEFAPTFC